MSHSYRCCRLLSASQKHPFNVSAMGLFNFYTDHIDKKKKINENKLCKQKTKSK